MTNEELRAAHVRHFESHVRHAHQRDGQRLTLDELSSRCNRRPEVIRDYAGRSPNTELDGERVGWIGGAA